MAKCRHPAHVDIQWSRRQASDNHCSSSRVVGHAIQHTALLLRFRVDAVSPAVDNLEAGDDIVGCTQYVEDSAVRTLQPLADDKTKLTLDPWLDESGDRDLRPALVEHVSQQSSVVGLRHVGGALHCA